MRTGVPSALGPALLFGAGTPLAKVPSGGIDPWLLAGIQGIGGQIPTAPEGKPAPAFFSRDCVSDRRGPAVLGIGWGGSRASPPATRRFPALHEGSARRTAFDADDATASRPATGKVPTGILAPFCQPNLFVDRGMVADLNVHRGEPMPDAGGTKIHAHVLLTLRSVGPLGFGPKLDFGHLANLQGVSGT
jgi:hypothetical protein